MPFITKADLEVYIDVNELNDITDTDDTKLDRPMADAESVVRGKLNHRYDTATIFANPSNENYATVKKITVDIAIFFIYSIVQSQHIPDHRVKLYEEADRWLHDIATGNWENDLPLRTPADDDDKLPGQGFASYDEFIESRY